jgi:hypothetical protein
MRVYTEVEVEVEDIMDDLSDTDLEEILKRRGHDTSRIGLGIIEDAYNALRRHDHSEAMTLLERFLWPRFRSVADCADLFKKQKAA